MTLSLADSNLSPCLTGDSVGFSVFLFGVCLMAKLFCLLLEYCYVDLDLLLTSTFAAFV